MGNTCAAHGDGRRFSDREYTRRRQRRRGVQCTVQMYTMRERCAGIRNNA